MTNHNSIRFPYAIIYYDGEDKYECGECNAFVEKLKNKWHESPQGKKFTGFSDWKQPGRDKFTLLMNVIQSSKSVVMLFSRCFYSERWGQYQAHTAFMDALHNKDKVYPNIYPVSILDGQIPEVFSVIHPVKFGKDWRNDHDKWKKLVDTLLTDAFADNDLAYFSDQGHVPTSTRENHIQKAEIEILYDQNLVTLARNLSHEMLKLGIHLGFTVSEVDHVQRDHRGSTFNQIFCLLELWRQRQSTSPQKKAETLADAMHEIGRLDLQKMIKGWIDEHAEETHTTSLAQPVGDVTEPKMLVTSLTSLMSAGKETPLSSVSSDVVDSGSAGYDSGTTSEPCSTRYNGCDGELGVQQDAQESLITQESDPGSLNFNGPPHTLADSVPSGLDYPDGRTADECTIVCNGEVPACHCEIELGKGDNIEVTDRVSPVPYQVKNTGSGDSGTKAIPGPLDFVRPSPDGASDPPLPPRHVSSAPEVSSATRNSALKWLRIASWVACAYHLTNESEEFDLDYHLSL